MKVITREYKWIIIAFFCLVGLVVFSGSFKEGLGEGKICWNDKSRTRDDNRCDAGLYCDLYSTKINSVKCIKKCYSNSDCAKDKYCITSTSDRNYLSSDKNYDGSSKNNLNKCFKKS